MAGSKTGPRKQSKAGAGPAGPARLQIRLTPRSSRDRILGREGRILKIALTAPPVGNQANQSLVRFLAKALGARAGDLSIERGASSRLKTVAIGGLGAEELEARLQALTAGLGDGGGGDETGQAGGDGCGGG